tara:strand:- start:887 stop:1135 length:249 start_codon:yes stop_codon:yes gene_type:complete
MADPVDRLSELKIDRSAYQPARRTWLWLALGIALIQVVFDFAVTPDLLSQGLVAALIIGLVGGFFPAIRAARLPVAQALREL